MKHTAQYGDLQAISHNTFVSNLLLHRHRKRNEPRAWCDWWGNTDFIGRKKFYFPNLGMVWLMGPSRSFQIHSRQMALIRLLTLAPRLRVKMTDVSFPSGTRWWCRGFLKARSIVFFSSSSSLKIVARLFTAVEGRLPIIPLSPFLIISVAAGSGRYLVETMYLTRELCSITAAAAFALSHFLLLSGCSLTVNDIRLSSFPLRCGRGLSIPPPGKQHAATRFLKKKKENFSHTSWMKLNLGAKMAIWHGARMLN